MKAKYYTKPIILVLVTIIFLAGYAQTNSGEAIINSSDLQMKYAQPQIVKLESNKKGMHVEYVFNGFKVSNRKQGGKSYQYLHIKDFGKMSEVGKPALPANNVNVIIPSSQFEIEIQNANFVEYDGYEIHPALKEATDLAGDPEPEFEIDSIQYSTDEFFPESIVECVNTGLIRGVKIATIQIRPIQYNPVTKKIRVYENIEYKIVFSGSQIDFDEYNRKNSANFHGNNTKTFLNSNIIPKGNTHELTKQSGGSYNIILLTVDSLQQAADSLAQWKRQMGYTVEILSNSSWTAAQIKDSVTYRYNTWAVHPDYLILLGDAPMVPSNVITVSTNYFYTDLYYVTMDGPTDYYADMASGRISVKNLSQALMVVQKIINYERNPTTTASFYSKSMNAAYFQDGTNYANTFDGYADRRFLHTSEEAKAYLNSKGYTVERIYDAFANRNPTYYNNGYYSDGQAIPSDLLRSNGFTWSGTATDINAAINDGRFLVLHRDHGYTNGYGWEHPYYLNYEANGVVSNGNHINQLTNGDKLPVLLSINCNTGQFSMPECFAENFIRKENGGAVGVIADSYTSYSGYNDAVAIGIYDAIWSNPGLIPNFGSGGFASPNVNTHSDIFSMGDVLNQAMLRMTQTWAGTASIKRQMEIFHYFGDPSMKIWTSNPTTITCDLPEVLERFTNSIEISNSSCIDGIATLMFNGELIGSTQLVNGNGIIEFETDTFGEAILTITKHNFRPLIRKYNIDNRIKNIAPTTQASNIQCIENAKSKDVVVEWELGDGDFRLVIINTDNYFTDPVDGVDYDADSYYQGSGEQVVYNGNGTSVLIQNLDDNIIYWIRVYEYNNLGIYTLYQTTTEINNPNTSIQNGGMLPIILVDFKAKISSDDVILSWSTMAEINNSHFEVLKTTDLKKVEVVDIVIGSGNSNVLRHYSATDKIGENDLVYYALRQVDFDGNYTTTDFISVNCQVGEATILGGFELLENSIEISFNNEDEALIELFTADGKLGFEYLKPRGEYVSTLNTQGVRTGVYLLRVSKGNLMEVKKIVIN